MALDLADRIDGDIDIAGSGLPFQLGGTSLLIIVNVTIDTISQIQRIWPS